MNPTISKSAREMIERVARHHLQKIGDQYVPTIVWFVDESFDESKLTGHVGIGFMKKDEAQQRHLIAGSGTLPIYNHIPEQIISKFQSHYIDVENGELKFATPS